MRPAVFGDLKRRWIVTRVVRVVRDSMFELAYRQVLAVIQSGRGLRCHARQCTDLTYVL